MQIQLPSISTVALGATLFSVTLSRRDAVIASLALTTLYANRSAIGGTIGGTLLNLWADASEACCDPFESPRKDEISILALF